MRALVLAAAVASCLAACKESDGALYPIGPGGGGPGGGTGHGELDGGLADGQVGGDQLAGEVCLITDARQPNACATTGAGGFTVALDGSIAVTKPDGTFVIDAPHSSNISWQVTGADLITSVMSYSAVNRIPVMADVDYLDLANSNSVIQSPGQGDVFIHVTHQGADAAMVAATPTPLGEFPTLFDGGTATTWTQVGTGALGMVWIPGVAQGTASVTLTPQGGTATVVNAIPVGDQTLTWVNVELP